MKYVVFLFLLLLPISHAGTVKKYRVQKYAAFKAHSILPGSLKLLVERNGKHLFAGVERGLAVPKGRIDAKRIMEETNKITGLVNGQRPFRQVVYQMGFVSGLLAVYTDPSRNTNGTVRRGFQYYLNLKLGRFHFVFDGYASLARDEARLREELVLIPKKAGQYQVLLVDRYKAVRGDSSYAFDERSAVFGISSLYFSELARLSAHLWFYAWSRANGDMTQTPFLENQTKR